MSLEKLAALSNKYGSDASCVIAGGGNTSLKDEKFLYLGEIDTVPRSAGQSLPLFKAEGRAAIDVICKSVRRTVSVDRRSPSPRKVDRQRDFRHNEIILKQIHIFHPRAYYNKMFRISQVVRMIIAKRRDFGYHEEKTDGGAYAIQI